MTGRITMALATRGPNFCKPDVVRYEWELAKELGINITVHVAMDRFGYTKRQLTALRDMDLLYPNTTYIHASHLTDEEWELVARLGRQRLVRAADRGPDGPRLGAGGEGRRARHPGRTELRRGHDRVVRPVHPDARDLRLGTRPQHQASWDEDLDGQHADART